jgi:hypothetical protein
MTYPEMCTLATGCWTNLNKIRGMADSKSTFHVVDNRERNYLLARQ